MTESGWVTREMPILMALGEMEGSTESRNDTETLSERTGLGLQTVQLGVAALVDGEYVNATGDVSGMDDVLPYYFTLQLREKGRRAIEQWPAEETAVDTFIEALNTLISSTDDDDEKSKLEKLRDSAKSVGKPTMIGLLTAYANARLGI